MYQGLPPPGTPSMSRTTFGANGPSSGPAANANDGGDAYNGTELVMLYDYKVKLLALP